MNYLNIVYSFLHGTNVNNEHLGVDALSLAGSSGRAVFPLTSSVLCGSQVRLRDARGLGGYVGVEAREYNGYS